MTTRLILGGGGSAYSEVEAPRLVREAAVYVCAVQVDGVRITLPMVSFAICDPEEPLSRSDEDVIARYNQIVQAQIHRYQVALGDPKSKSASQYRVAFVVEDLLLGTAMRLPGIRAFGIGSRPEGVDAAMLLAEASTKLGWVGKPLQPQWAEAFKKDHPVAVLACDSVFAKDIKEADLLATTARDELLSVLALNRGSFGRPVVTLIERRQNKQTVETKFRFDHRAYAGNLAVGPIAGENQSHLLLQHAAIRGDPLLKLCVDLYGEALGDRSPDARYFRFWSVLETLALSRIPSGMPVMRLDGTAWPNQTTSNAAPRVYRLVAECLFTGSVNEASAVSPAADLFQAIRSWYARRNATAHYGKFVPGDPSQSSQNWYPRALATFSPHGQADTWLRALQHTCAGVLNAEMASVGTSLVP